MTTMNREEQKQVLIDTAKHIINRDNTSPYSENLRELARIALASLEAEPVAKIIAHYPLGIDVGKQKFVQAIGELPDFGGHLFAAPPVPVVPEEKPMPNPLKMYAVDAVAAIAEVRGWNACRAAMLHGAEPVSQTYKLNELSGNYPVTPDGWVMVPKEPTQAMIKAWLSEIANFRGHAAGYRAALEAAPQLEVNRG